MTIKLNGEITEFNEGSSIKEVLKEAKIEMIEYVTIQVNGEFIDGESFASTLVKENDEIEYLYFMGGGSYGIQ